MSERTSTFAFTAVSRTGSREHGSAEAASMTALSRTLEARGLIVVDIERVQAAAAPAVDRAWGRSRREVLELTRGLAALLGARLPLSRALTIAGELAQGRVAAAAVDVRSHIDHGESLGSALARHPALFPALYVGVVKAGESSGDLAGAFTVMAEQLERQDRLRGKLLSAAIYPLLLLLASGAAVATLVLVVLPRFAELLDASATTLPWSTAFLLRLSGVASSQWPALLVAAMLAAAGVSVVAGTDRGRRLGARLLLGVPVVGTIRRSALGARFARALGVLLGGGAPILDALEEAAAAVADPIASDEIARVRGRVREGISLAGALAERGIFPPLVPRLVAVGEESGRLDEFLARTAELLEDRAERLLQRLVTLFEPAMIIVLGLVVAFVAMSLLQAIYGVDAGAFR